MPSISSTAIRWTMLLLWRTLDDPVMFVLILVQLNDSYCVSVFIEGTVVIVAVCVDFL